MSTPDITVWSKPQCVQCDATKRKLDKAGIAYTEHDLTEHPDKAAEFRDQGYATAPIVITPRGAWAGYQHDHLKRLAAERNPA